MSQNNLWLSSLINALDREETREGMKDRLGARDILQSLAGLSLAVTIRAGQKAKALTGPEE